MDYIINCLSYIHENEYDIKHFINSVNILVMLLINPNNKGIEDLDSKLLKFVDEDTSKEIGYYIRQIRNKIAHGDFKKVSEFLKKYAKNNMKDFIFDCSERDRETWIISNLCIKTDRILSKVLWLMLEDNNQLLQIQNDKIK